MNPHTHFLIPFTLTFILVKLNILPWWCPIIAGLIGVAIDLDHYIEHILHAKRNKFSLKATWNNSMKYHTFKQQSFIHNTKGFLILSFAILAFTGLYWQEGVAIFIGYYSHLLLDHIHLKQEKFIQWRSLHLYIQVSPLEIVYDCIFIPLTMILLFL